MSRSWLISFLCHAVVFGAAWHLTVRGAGHPSRTVLYVVGNEPLATAEDPLAAPPPPAPSEALEIPEETECVAEPEPAEHYETIAEPPTEALATPRSIRPVRLPVPLRKPPVRNAPARPVASPPPLLVVPEAPRLRPPAAPGPSRTPQLAGGAAGPIDYPPLARRRGWEGRVVLRIRVAADGAVISAAIAESSGRTCLDEAAMRAARRWRFEPALDRGRAVAGWTTRTVRFRLLKAES